jgi:hypothetical protein
MRIGDVTKSRQKYAGVFVFTVWTASGYFATNLSK